MTCNQTARLTHVGRITRSLSNLNWTPVFLNQAAVQYYKIAWILVLLGKILEMYLLHTGNF